MKPYILLLLLTVSCATPNQLRSVTNRVWNYGKAHPEGFTLDIRTMQEPRQGIAVAYQDGRLCSTKKELRQTVSHAIDHDGYVGGWAAEEGYDFDSVRLFPEDSLSAAFDFAAANGQKAVFVLSSGEEIRLQGPGQEEFSPSTLIIMCDQAVGKDHLRTAVKEFGAEIIYDYNIICGMAIRIPQTRNISEAMAFFAGIPGVVAVERDRIHQLID